MQVDGELYDSNISAPLYWVAAKISSIWLVSMAVYYQVLPLLRAQVTYNTEPLGITLYFVFWVWVSLTVCRDLFTTWLATEYWLWLYVLQSIAGAVIVFGLLVVVALLPEYTGSILGTVGDLLLASPWYFLPKAAEILLQQVLIVALILTLSHRFTTLRRISIWYAALFGSAHVVYFLLSAPVSVYTISLTLAAILSALVFPWLVLRVRGGFVYAYLLHLLFYIMIAVVLQSLPQ